MINKKNRESRLRIKKRVRTKIYGTTERPRLTVYRSARHIYAQIVDDMKGQTLAAASTLEKNFRDELKSTKSPIEVAKLIGKHAAQKAVAAEIKNVVFDRNGYRYHGRVKALADGAREGGLNF